MSSASQIHKIDLSISDAIIVLQKIVREFGWKVLELDSSRIVAGAPSRLPNGKTTKITVDITQISETKCQLSIDGYLMAVAAKSFVEGQIGKLVNAVFLDANNKNKESITQNSVSVSDELSTLADMYKQNLLTKEEYEAAKRKLLG